MARRILFGMVGLLLLGGTARAQSDVRDRVDPPASLAGETYLGPHIGYSFIGKYEKIYCPCDTDQNDFLFGGVRVGHFFADHFALEATGQYFRPDRDRISDYWELTLGGLYDFTPRWHGWNTYLAFGGGISRHATFDNSVIGQDSFTAPLAYLAGGSEYRFGKLVGLRLELKGQYNFHSHFNETVNIGPSTHRVENSGHLDVQPTIGVLFHFGGRGSARVVDVPPAPIPPTAPAPAPPPPAPAPPAAPKEPERPAAPPAAPAPPPPQAPLRDMIDFDHGKARVTNIAKAKLDAVALRLRDNPRATVTITGYPDAGAGPRQEALARQRAENVKQYLIERHGIDASRLTTRIDMTDTSNRTRAVVVTILP
jgi:outer membrane protein OmpA-like peptidoglycan-associated protein